MILTDRQPFTDEDRAILISYKAVVDGVSALIGEHCEIVLHSLEDIEHSAICIANGHNTNRQVGSPITDLALKSLRNMQSESVSKPYFTRAKGNALFAISNSDGHRLHQHITFRSREIRLRHTLTLHVTQGFQG